MPRLIPKRERDPSKPDYHPPKCEIDADQYEAAVERIAAVGRATGVGFRRAMLAAMNEWCDRNEKRAGPG